MLWLLKCPDPACDALAEAFDRVSLASTDGPFEHVRTRCLDGHVFVLPAARAAPVHAAEPAGRAPGANRRSDWRRTG